METSRRPFFSQMCFSGIRVPVYSILVVVVTLTFIPSLAPGQDSSASTNQPPMRTNPQDVQLATLASSANTAPSDNGSSQDQWKSLTTAPSPDSDPMVTPSPSPITPSTNNISALVSESKPKPILKKDDYGPQTGWGLRTSAGVALQQSISGGQRFGEIHQDINFEPGFRWDFEPFYNITNGFSFGLESGFIYNAISSYLISYPGFTQGRVSGDYQTGNSAYYQIPVLLNIKFEIPNSGRLRSYFTGGVGGVWDYWSAAATIYSSPQDGPTTATLINISEHQWNYAFQLGAGLQYNLMPGLDLDTSFKTFITPNPLIFSDGTSQVKASYNYALEIGLAYRF